MKLERKPQYETLSVVRLGKTDWRISDAIDHDILLGFIERQRAGRFEVTWMSDPMRWGYTASFDDALTAFADSTRFAGEVFPERARVELASIASAGVQQHRTTWLKPTRTSTTV
jgi:hypothetical protein